MTKEQSVNVNATDSVSLENSKIVAETYHMLNEVIDQQFQIINTRVIKLIHATIDLVKDAKLVSQDHTVIDDESIKDNFNESVEKIETLTENTKTSISAPQSLIASSIPPDTNPPTFDFNVETQKALVSAYANTVYAQQQINVTALAASTVGTAFIHDVLRKALGAQASEK